VKSIFKHTAALVTGEYFMGHYHWTAPRSITSASIVLTRPVAGFVFIALEVNGVLTGEEFQISPGTGEIRQSIQINRTVPVGHQIRWLVRAFAGVEADAATNAAIVLETADPNLVTGLAPDLPLTVRWVDGIEDVRLYNYVSGVFTAVASLDNRGAILPVPSGINISIHGAPCATIRSQGVTADEFLEVDRLFTPRLEFWRGSLRLGCVMTGGRIYTPALIEATPEASPARFEFSVGTLKATLGVEGLTAVGFEEPLAL